MFQKGQWHTQPKKSTIRIAGGQDGVAAVVTGQSAKSRSHRLQVMLSNVQEQDQIQVLLLLLMEEVAERWTSEFVTHFLCIATSWHLASVS